MSLRRFAPRSLPFVLAGFCLLPTVLRAQTTLYWQGGANGQWFNGAIWHDGNETPVTWSNGHIAWFNGNETVGNAGNVPLSLAGIRFGWSPGTLDTVTTLTSNNLTLTGSATIAANDSVGRARLNLNAPISGTAGLTFAGPGVLWLNGASTYTGDTTLTRGTLIAAQSTALSTGSITLAGEGNNTALRLDASVAGLTLANAITVAAGTGTASIGSSAGTHATTFAGPLTLNRATTLVDGNTTGLGTTFSGAISGNVGTLSISGPRIILSATNTFTGGVSVADSSILVLNSSAGAKALPSSALLELNDAGVLILHGHNSVGQLTGGSGSSVQVRADQPSATLTLGGGNGDSIFAGTLRDTGAGTVEGGPQLSLAKSGSSTLTLSGTNTYTGGTTFAGGTLALGSAGALGSSGTLSFTGGTLQFSAANTTDYTPRFSNALNQLYRVDTNGQNVTFGTALASAGGSLTKLGAGTLTLTANNTHTGGTAVAGGTLILAPTSGRALPVNAPLTIGPGATLQLNASGQLPTITEVDGGTLHLNDVLGSASSLIMTGGQVTASGANGRLNLVGTVTTHAADSTVTISAPFLPAFPVTFNVARNAAAPNAVDLELSGSIVGPSNNPLTKIGDGTLLLSGANAPYVGTIFLSAGTLLVGSDSALGSGPIIFNGGTLAASGERSLPNSLVVGSAAANFSGADTLNLTGTVTDASARGLVKSGSGTLVLAGTGTSFTGNTTINAGTLRLDAADRLADTMTVTLANAAGATLDLNDHSETVGTLSGGGALGGHVDLGSGTLTITSTANATFGGVISGTGGITLAGGKPTLTLSGANTYTGTTLVSSGILTLGANNVLADTSSLVVTPGGSFALGNFNDTVASVSLLDGSIIGSGVLTSTSTFDVQSGAVFARLGGSAGLTKTGAGTVTLNGINTYTGVTTVSAGTLSLGNKHLLADASTLLVNGGIFALNQHAETIAGLTLQSGVITGTGTLSSTSSLQLESGKIDVRLIGSGAGVGLTKTTTSNVQLTGTGHTFTGDVTIAEGSLSLAGTLSTTGSLILASGTLFDIQQASVSAAAYDVRSGTIGAALTGSASLTKSTAGTVTLTGANTYTGDTIITAGTLSLNGGAAISDLSAVSLAPTAGATLNLQFGETIRTLTGGGASGGQVTLNTHTLTLANPTAQTFSGTISGTGGLTKNGSGAFTLDGANIFTGTTTIGGGRLILAGGSALADTSAVTLAATANTELQLAASETIGSLAGGGSAGGNVLLDTHTLTLGGANTSTTFSGVISGSGALVKNGTGTFTLDGTNTFTGATTINAGTLRLSGGAALVDTAAVTLTANGGGTFELLSAETIGSLSGATSDLSVHLNGASSRLTTGDAANTTFAGIISGSGGLTKQGSGTFTLSGANTYTGSTFINAGMLALAGASSLPSTASISLANTAGATLAVSGAGATLGSIQGGGTSGGSVTLAGGGTLTLTNAARFDGTLSGSGAVKIEGGNFTANGANTYTGGTALSGGNLIVGHNSALGTGTLTIHGGTLASDGTRTLANTVSLAADLAVAGSSNLTLAGAVTQTGGSFGLTKTGTGNLILAGSVANTFAGPVTITGGTLTLNKANNIANFAGSVIVGSGGTLAYAGFNQLAGEANTVTVDGGTFDMQGTGYRGFARSLDFRSGTLTTSHASAETPVQLNLSADTSGAFTLHGGLSTPSSLTLALTGASPTSGVTYDPSINTGASTINGAILLAGGGGTFTVGDGSAAVDLHVTGRITEAFGARTVVKTGAGTLLLSGNNTYTGGTRLAAGALVIGSNTALGSGAFTIDTGTVSAHGGARTLANAVTLAGDFTLDGTDALTFSGAATLTDTRTVTSAAGSATTFSGTFGQSGGAFGLIKTGDGTLTLAGTNTYTGTTTVNAGTLNLSATGGGAIKGDFTVNAGAVARITHPNQIADTSAIALDGGTLHLDNAVEGHAVGGLTLTGGHLTAAGTGRFDLGGTLTTLASASTSTVTAPMRLSANSTFQVAAGSAPGGIDLDLSGAVGESSAGSVLTKTGAGTLRLGAVGSYSGGTTITAGTLRLGAADVLPDTGTVTVASGATLHLGGHNEAVASLAGSGTLQIGGATLTVGVGHANGTFAGALSGPGALVKTGTGTLALTGASDYTGGTTVNAGLVEFSHLAHLGNGAVTLNGGGMRWASGSSTDLSPRLTALGAAGATFDTNGNTVALAGALSGGALTKTGSGVLTLAGANTHAATTIAAGTLRLAGGAALADSSTVTFANTAGAILDLNGTTETVTALAGGGAAGGNVTLGNGTLTLAASSGSASHAGALSGAGSLRKTGAGTQVLSGASTFSGGTMLSAGTLAVGSNSALGTGTLTLDGGALRAHGGARTLANAVVLNADSTLGGSDALTLTGNVTLARTRDLTVTGSAVTTLAGTIAESGLGRGLTKYGDGELQLTAANTYTGGTFIGEGTVRINNTAGSAFGTGAVTVAAGATLTGSGSFSGALQLNGTYSPGNSPGLQQTGSQTWAGGAALVWDINDFGGTAGTDPGWDTVSIDGLLHINALAATPFTIDLTSLTLGNLAGLASGFDDASNYSFDLVTTTAGITFATGASIDASFALDTTGFLNAFTGNWSLELTHASHNLTLNYTSLSSIPEPSTYAALFGACVLGFAAWHKRRRSTPA